MFYDPKMLTTLTQLALGETRNVDGEAPLPHARTDSGRGVHRTLVPVDGSEEAEGAIEYAVSLAQRGLTAEIHLLNVQPMVMKGDFAFDVLVHEEETARLAAAQEIMHNARVRLAGRVPAKAAVRFGHAASAIARYANEQGIAAIAMATRATRSLRERFRRSVAVDVVRRVSVPVTLLKPARDSDARRPH